MADFDSASKRFSGIGMGAWDAPLLPIPDGTLGAGDRLHLLDLYSGLVAAPAGGRVRIWDDWSRPYFLGRYGQ